MPFPTPARLVAHRVVLGMRRSCLCWPGWRRHKPRGGCWRGRWASTSRTLFDYGGALGCQAGLGGTSGPLLWKKPAWFGSVPAGGGGEEVGTGEAGARHSAAGAGARLPLHPHHGEHLEGGRPGPPNMEVGSRCLLPGGRRGAQSHPSAPRQLGERGGWGSPCPPPHQGGFASVSLQDPGQGGRVVPRFAGQHPPQHPRMAPRVTHTTPPPTPLSQPSPP